MTADSRLTDTDRMALAAALDSWLHALRLATRPTPWNAHAQLCASHNVETVRRVMAHAIGCSLHDLRDSEIAVIDGLISDRRDA